MSESMPTRTIAALFVVLSAAACAPAEVRGARCTYSICGPSQACPTGHACHRGTCMPTCVNDADCPASCNAPLGVTNLCTSGVCVEVSMATCTGPAACMGHDCVRGRCAVIDGGTSCVLPSDCPDGSTCTDGACTFASHGASCRDAAACPAGLSCVEGSCRGGSGTGCGSDADCIGLGTCVGGFCGAREEGASFVCAPGVVCAAGQMCLDEMCHGEAAPECATHADCAAGQACEEGRCVRDASCDCAPDETCVDGSCVPALGCASDAQCGMGERCVAGVCEAAGLECASHADCAPGQDCVEGVCTASSSCRTSADCAPGQRCLDGVCRSS